VFVQYHPDKNPNNRDECERKIKDINDAYENINSAQKRKEYDLRQSDPFGRQNNNFNGFNPFGQTNNQHFTFTTGGSGGQTFSFSSNGKSPQMPSSIRDILEEMFGGGVGVGGFGDIFAQPQQRQRQQSSHQANSKPTGDGKHRTTPPPGSSTVSPVRPPPLTVYVSLEDMYSGANKTYRIHDIIELSGDNKKKICREVTVRLPRGCLSDTYFTFPPTSDFPQQTTVLVKQKPVPTSTSALLRRERHNLVYECTLTKEEEEKIEVDGSVLISVPILGHPNPSRSDQTNLNQSDKNKSLLVSISKGNIVAGVKLVPSYGMPFAAEKENKYSYGDLIVRVKRSSSRSS
jgi:DnaJ-class molecular chaperone